MNTEKFGQYLGIAITSSGFTTKQFAESIHVSASTIGTIISGKRKPSIDVFFDIIEALDIPPEYLLRNDLRKAEEFCLLTLLNDNFMNLPPNKQKLIEKLCVLVAENV